MQVDNTQIASDHHPVLIDIDLETQPLAQGY